MTTRCTTYPDTRTCLSCQIPWELTALDDIGFEITSQNNPMEKKASGVFFGNAQYHIHGTIRTAFGKHLLEIAPDSAAFLCEKFLMVKIEGLGHYLNLSDFCKCQSKILFSHLADRKMILELGTAEWHIPHLKLYPMNGTDLSEFYGKSYNKLADAYISEDPRAFRRITQDYFQKVEEERKRQDELDRVEIEQHEAQVKKQLAQAEAALRPSLWQRVCGKEYSRI